ncbi:S41 family peptidase [Sporosarcina sp. FA9]|uniref:S41 family peptidase n=1 Tax=Sporosarcina sp. FA9 TaxID=3413030 RepID=UPI003F658E5D
MGKMNISTLFAIIISFLLITTAQASTLDEVKSIVESDYYGEIPKNLREMSSIQEIIKTLDKYTQLMTNGEYDQYMKMIGEEKLENVDLVAALPSLQTTVTSKILYGDTGYIRITNFSAELGSHIAIHWNSLKKRGATKLIIDLRDNGGGFVESAQELLGFFEGVKNSFHIYTRYEEKLMPVVPTMLKFPKDTFVLINRRSASASEIVAVSLKEQQAATIVGEKSYGKGTIQSFYPLTDGVLKITTGQFTGPAGTVVNKTGVQPDIGALPDQEVMTAHGEIIEKSLTDKYSKKLFTLALKNSYEPFRIHLPHKMNFSQTGTSNRVELVQLGGGAVPITISQSEDFKSVMIQPNQALDDKAEYIVIVHPELKYVNGKRSKKGVYTLISFSNVNK